MGRNFIFPSYNTWRLEQDPRGLRWASPNEPRGTASSTHSSSPRGSGLVTSRHRLEHRSQRARGTAPARGTEASETPLPAQHPGLGRGLPPPPPPPSSRLTSPRDTAAPIRCVPIKPLPRAHSPNVVQACLIPHPTTHSHVLESF
ncbi:UNVERIFIED_CONTAM: hypothetical protein Sradi_0049100 [Sesamum radiatum]|uniref:Uncharacterized protein n=1 Tax=Sesamum radiatum TaxID=300843 RepID=A0AAW2WH04_SESRA